MSPECPLVCLTGERKESLPGPAQPTSRRTPVRPPAAAAPGPAVGLLRRRANVYADAVTSAEEMTPVREGLTPKQARQLRMGIAGIAMAAMAVVLVIQLGDGSSLLSVGLYGAAFVLSGVVIEMCRRGRTRLGTAVLVTGFVLVLATNWWLHTQ
jgi:hypothetical protein